MAINIQSVELTFDSQTITIESVSKGTLQAKENTNQI